MSDISYAIPYYIARSPIHGKGVFASRPIKEGEIIGTLNVSPATRNGHHVLWISENQKVRVNCSLRYVNHSDDPNLDDDGFAIKDINIGDEIVINYKDFDDSIDKWLI